jgi:hypothetical protein
MKRSPALSKLIILARTARKKIETLSQVEGGPSNLAGYCGVAARYLELLANKENISPEFVAGSFKTYSRILDTYHIASGHTWIEYDGYIVDITATQFKNVVSKIDRNFSQKIYVCRNNNPHYSKELIGDIAKRCVRMWYCETLEEICQKINEVNQ